jgi:aminoglycoside phosphotransferase (APT) family kinase protein
MHPWHSEKSLSSENVILLLQENIPDLFVDSIQVLGEGWDNTTWLINQQWVFRIPKHQRAEQLIRNEINLLPYLPEFNLQYPKPELIVMSPRHYPYPFYGHRYLAGITAERAHLTTGERANLATPLGEFLNTLHAFPITEAQHLGVQFDDVDRVNVKTRYELIAERLQYLTFHKVIIDPEYYINLFLPHLDLQSPPIWVLGHGDFYARHLLLDANKQLCGVIDWGDCELLHPAIDLRIAYHFLPQNSHEAFWKAYGEVDETTKLLAKLCAVYNSITMAWYAHQIADQDLLAESLFGLGLVKEL